jgi:hypothetical protein
MQTAKYGVLLPIRALRLLPEYSYSKYMFKKVRIKHAPDEPSPQQQKGIAVFQQCPLVKSK